MRNLKYAGLLLGLFVGLGSQSASFAQAIVEWLPTGLGNWNVNANWRGAYGNFVPESVYDEVGRINTGGTAQVTDTPPPVGGIAITNGAVDISPTGNLVVEAAASATGGITVGNNGALTVAGKLSCLGLQSSGTLRTVGASSALSITGDMTQTGTMIAELTSASHGAVNVSGNATLGGSFIADFNGAPTSHGSAWNIITADSFSGGFSTVTFTGAALPTGQVAGIQQVGSTLRLAIEQRLVLSVDRETGIFSILNPTSSTISFTNDGYAIDSAAGSLNPTPWNSLDDQGFEAGAWYETGTGGSMYSVAELNPTTAWTLAPNQSRAIGTIYSPNFDFVAFGQDYEDYVFSYHRQGGPSEQGVVIFSGDKQENNIVLTINPTTGDAVMQNESEISVQFDSYTIFSESGALLASWDSLSDQGVTGGAWLEANPTTHRVSEVMRQGVTTFDQNEGYFLDGLFKTGGTQDLTFQYLVAGTTTVMDGVVQYGLLPANVQDPDLADFNEADFDRDGDVDGNDLLAWRGGFGTQAGAQKGNGDFDNDGDVDGADFLGWQANLGSGSGCNATAIPEPGSLGLAFAAMICLLCAAVRKIPPQGC